MMKTFEYYHFQIIITVLFINATHSFLYLSGIGLENTKLITLMNRNKTIFGANSKSKHVVPYGIGNRQIFVIQLSHS